MNTWVQQFAELNGVTQPVNGSWIQAICEAEGITQPVNGTWIEALARNKGATEPYNGSWWAALAVALGINNVSNGTWIQALAENGLFSNVLGVIMEDDYTGGNWTAEGVATFTNNGTTIAMSGGNNATTNLYYYNNYVTCLEDIKWEVTATVNNSGATDYGFAVGLKSRNAYFGGGIGRTAYVQFITNSGADQGKIRFYNVSTAIQTSVDALAFSNGDSIKLTYEFVYDTWTFTATNLNTNNSITFSYQFTDVTLAESLPYLTNTASPCLWTFGGSQTVTSFTLSSQQQKGMQVLAIGDSKTKGYYAEVFSDRFTDLAGFENNSGAGDGIIHVELRLDEIISLQPQNVILNIGCNDLRAGTASATWQAAYNNVVSTLEAEGITVWNCLPIPEDSIDLTSLKTWLESNHNNLIDLWTPFKDATTGINEAYDCGDNIHPNRDAQFLIANILKFEVGLTSVDPYAQTYADRVGLNATETTYVDTFVKGLQTDGIWSGMTAIYPFMGGTADKHKWNLKQPANSNSAFRLSFVGGWVHGATGATPNGTTGYANTFVQPNLHMSLNSSSMSYYSRTNEYTNVIDMGCSNNLTIFNILEINRNAAGGIKAAIIHSNARTGTIGIGNTGSLGHYIGSRTASNSQKLYRDGAVYNSSASASTALYTVPIFIASINVAGTPTTFSAKEVCFAHVGAGLDDTQAANLYSRVNTLQTALSRNV